MAEKGRIVPLKGTVKVRPEAFLRTNPKMNILQRGLIKMRTILNKIGIWGV
jgi:hypothetical protein